MQSRPWQKTQAIAAFLQQSDLPETPGVYFFLNDEQEILYIGKATSLRDRVKSYFTEKVVVTRGPKIELLMKRATVIGYTVTDSVLEALLLEGELIKQYQPPHNTDAKDDKSYNRVVITKEAFPRVLLVRDREIAQGKFILPVKKMYGPFPSGNDLKAALKIIRKLFPYRDTCTPCTESGSKKPCFSRQVGLCPGVCTGEITARDYQRKVRRIELFFEGKKQMLVKRLEKEMEQLAKELRFEEAAEVKKLLFGVLLKTKLFGKLLHFFFKALHKHLFLSFKKKLDATHFPLVIPCGNFARAHTRAKSDLPRKTRFFTARLCAWCTGVSVRK
jgi:excinuclease ABC subunit C